MIQRGDAGRAVCLLVTTFPPAEDDAGTQWIPLDEFAPYSGALVEALEGLGYETSCPEQPTAQDMGTLVRELVAPDPPGARIVHVLSHGHLDRQELYVVAGNGWSIDHTNVTSWIRRVAVDPDAPYTLFLLDLCHSGAAARIPWKEDPDPRAWVIASAETDGLSYDARFTRAAATVLSDLTAGRLDGYGSHRYVSLDVVARAISREVGQLIDTGQLAQQVTASRADISTDLTELPFFRNPHFDEHQLRVPGDPAVGAYLDEVLDVAHWRERSAGHAFPIGQVRAGCFTGRRTQLEELVPWLNNEVDDRASALRIVTGSPGAGKSALLGILVCAAHPALSDPAEALWSPVFMAEAPSVNDDLAAVHARQATLPTICASLAAQLGLTGIDTAGETGSAELYEAIRRRTHQPVIVLDALDEAVDPSGLLDRLLLPLLAATRPDGRPATRILLGVRPNEPLLGPLRALTAGGLLDLNRIDTEVLRTDLQRYVAALLRLSPGYQRTTHEKARQAFAAAVANTLIERRGEADPEWGEFLVAALHTHHLLRSHVPGTDHEGADADWAARIGAQVPATLPEILDADLQAQTAHNPWIEVVLTMLARARGQGMPLSVLRRLAAATRPDLTAPTPDDLQTCLDEARFYLRQVPDLDGTTLYRLFHQSLADHLGDRPGSLDDTLDLLLGQSELRWQVAEPYVLRHAADEAVAEGRLDELAVDPAFLIHADIATALPALDRLRQGEPGRLERAVLRTSAHLPGTPAQRRDLLTLDAARWGATELAERLREVPVSGARPPRHHPLWATGTAVTSALHATFGGLRTTVTALAVTGGDEPRVVVGGHDRFVRILDPLRRRLVGGPLAGHRGQVTAAAPARIAGTDLAVTACAGGRLQLWDPRDGTSIRGFGDKSRAIRAVVSTELDGVAIAITGAAGGELACWNLGDGTRHGPSVTGAADILGVACAYVDARQVVVTVDSLGVLRLWDLAADLAPLGELTVHRGLATAVGCIEVEGRMLAVTAGLDQTVRLWDLAERAALGEPLRGHTAPVRSLACYMQDGRPYAMTGGDDQTVRTWDLTAGCAAGPPFAVHTQAVRAVAADAPIAVSAGDDQTVRLWDLAPAEPLGAPAAGHAACVRAAVHTGECVVTAADDAVIQVWDAGTGEALRRPRVEHSAPVPAMTHTRVGAVPVVLTADEDGLLARWRLDTGEAIGEPLFGHSGAIRGLATAEVDGRPVALTAGADRRVLLWELDDAEPVGIELDRHPHELVAVACSTLDGVPIAVSADEDGEVRIWDLRTRSLLTAASGRSGVMSVGSEITALACTDVAGGPVAVIGGAAGAQVWDLRSGVPGAPLSTVPVRAVVCAATDDGPHAITAHTDRTVRFWDLRVGRQIESLTFPAEVTALAVDEAGRTVAAFGRDLVVLEPRSPDATGELGPRMSDRE